jgi:hypothetical protein
MTRAFTRHLAQSMSAFLASCAWHADVPTVDRTLSREPLHNRTVATGNTFNTCLEALPNQRAYFAHMARWTRNESKLIVSSPRCNLNNTDCSRLG